MVEDFSSLFLLEAVAYRFGWEADAEALAQIAGLVDAHGLKRLRGNADYHELQSLLAELCEDCSRLGHPLPLPDELLQVWAATSQREQVRTTLIHYGATLALQALAGAGIRAIPLKGYHISTLYERPAARGFRDLDLLVERDSLQGLHLALLDAGFQPQEGRPAFVPAPAFTVYYIPIDGSDTGMEIDVHIGMHWPGEYFERTAFRGEDIWAEARELDGGGVKYWGMSNEHLVITTLLDVAVNHRYARLIKFRDLIELLRKQPVDWDTIAETASRWRVNSFVGPGLPMLREMDRGLVPEDIEGMIPSYALMRLFRRLLKAGDLPAHRSRSFTPSNLVFFLLGDTPDARARGVIHIPMHLLNARR